MFLGLGAYIGSSVLPIQLLPLSYLVVYIVLGLVGIGLLAILVGIARRNALTYMITDSDVVVQRQLLSRSVRRIPFASISDVEVSQSVIGRMVGYGNIAPVTKSGYGLVRGMDRTENLVAEMTDVPNPDKVANLILSKVSASSRVMANA